MLIVNLTQHGASAEQIKAGVFDLDSSRKDILREELTFDHLPSARDIRRRAEAIASLASICPSASGEFASHAMIGGAPYLMAPLESALRAKGIVPLYAFSVRESVEKVIDGATVKTNVFRHAGFVSVA